MNYLSAESLRDCTEVTVIEISSNLKCGKSSKNDTKPPIRLFYKYTSLALLSHVLLL